MNPKTGWAVAPIVTADRNFLSRIFLAAHLYSAKEVR
jgi:hypothetical protein